MATQYMMLLLTMFLGVGLTGFYTAIHSIEIARATMSRYLQIALQQTADASVTLDPTTGVQWTKAVTQASPVSGAPGENLPVENVFQQVLATTVTSTPWAHLPVTIQAFDVFTPQDIGNPAPFGYPGTTISGPGYYAEVTFPWKPIPFLPAVTVTVPEVMQANSLVEPGGVPPVWNPYN